MRSEKRRLGALTAALNPKGSFRARFADLTDEQRATYQRWRDRTDAWHAAKPDNAFERMLSGDEPPKLRRDISDALFGPTPVITDDMTADQVAEAYNRFARGD